jgi:hypothetical protein
MGTADIRSHDGRGEWWIYHHEVIAFARALVETDRLGRCQHRVIDYFCEPQRWTHAYRIWCKMGRPDGPGHPRFDELMKRYLAEGKALRTRAGNRRAVRHRHQSPGGGAAVLTSSPAAKRSGSSTLLATPSRFI